MDRAKKDDEERELELLKEQIEKASKTAEERGIVEQEATELKRDGEQPIKLSLSMKPATVTSEAPKSTGSKMMLGGMKKRTGLSALAKKSNTSSTAATATSSGMKMGSMMMKRKSNTDQDQDQEDSNKKIKA
jgi:DNA/RNA-binding protein KIN17